MIVFVTDRRIGADEEIDAAIIIVFKVFHGAVEIHAADFRAAVVVGAARVFAVQRESPELPTGYGEQQS